MSCVIFTKVLFYKVILNRKTKTMPYTLNLMRNGFEINIIYFTKEPVGVQFSFCSSLKAMYNFSSHKKGYNNFPVLNTFHFNILVVLLKLDLVASIKVK